MWDVGLRLRGSNGVVCHVSHRQGNIKRNLDNCRTQANIQLIASNLGKKGGRENEGYTAQRGRVSKRKRTETAAKEPNQHADKKGVGGKR